MNTTEIALLTLVTLNVIGAVAWSRSTMNRYWLKTRYGKLKASFAALIHRLTTDPTIEAAKRNARINAEREAFNKAMDALDVVKRSGVAIRG